MCFALNPVVPPPIVAHEIRVSSKVQVNVLPGRTLRAEPFWLFAAQSG